MKTAKTHLSFAKTADTSTAVSISFTNTGVFLDVLRQVRLHMIAAVARPHITEARGMEILMQAEEKNVPAPWRHQHLGHLFDRLGADVWRGHVDLWIP